MHSIVLYFTDEGVLHKLCEYQNYDKYLFFPTVQDFANDTDSFPFDEDALTYLFSVDDTHYFLLEGEPAYLPEGYGFTPIRNLRTVFLQELQGFSSVTGTRITVFVDVAAAKRFILLQSVP